MVDSRNEKKVKVYKRDFRLFNQNKTHLTLQNLRQSKKEYKTLAAKLKAEHYS